MQECDTWDLPPWRSLDLEARLRWALAPEIPDLYRQALAREQWVQTRCYFARRQDLRPSEVAQFAADDDYVIRLCIAKRPDLSPEQVAAFCSDRDPNVRYAIARNPLLNETQRQMLLQDPDEVVRQAAAKGARPSQTRQRQGQAALYR
ncbi:hypothetical protein MQE22_11550 [Acidithiobacillus sp. YTS05]|nr:hypothetical protein MQE22_11550 [Acidithiobacillus sp. YTS05]